MDIEAVSNIVKNIILSGAAITTGVVALVGLNRWQAELSGKANFDVARQLAKALYTIRNQINYYRSPFISGHEFPEEFQGYDRNKSNQNTGDAFRFVYINRWRPIGDAMKEFDVASLEAEALWGSEVKNEELELRSCIRSLQVDTETYVANKYDGGETLKDDAYRQEIEYAIWNVKEKENKFTKRLNKAISDIEARLRPHLSKN
jgi:hypothetical protein